MYLVRSFGQIFFTEISGPFTGRMMNLYSMKIQTAYLHTHSNEFSVVLLCALCTAYTKWVQMGQIISLYQSVDMLQLQSTLTRFDEILHGRCDVLRYTTLAFFNMQSLILIEYIFSFSGWGETESTWYVGH
jgi:hypothetical protein